MKNAPANLYPPSLSSKDPIIISFGEPFFFPKKKKKKERKKLGWILILIRSKFEEMSASAVYILEEQVAFLECIFSEVF